LARSVKLALPAAELDSVGDRIEAALGCRLVPRESSFVGAYRLGTLDAVTIALASNVDPIDGELHDDDVDRAELVLTLTGPSAAVETVVARISERFATRMVANATYPDP
jgi:hypothetical protein